MSWTTPRTYVTGEIVTAAILNTDHRDNLLDLDRRTNAGAAFILANESTGSTTYANLASIGPAVSAVVGPSGVCVVIVTARTFVSTSGTQAIMSYATTGATTLGAADSAACYGTSDGRQSAVNVQVGLTPGLNTFTAKYRTSNAAVGANFSDRAVIAIPMGA